MLRIPKATVRLSDSLKGPMGIRKTGITRLWCVTATGYQIKSAKGKNTWGKSQEKPA